MLLKRLQARAETLGMALLGIFLPLAFWPALEDAYVLPERFVLALALLLLALSGRLRIRIPRELGGFLISAFFVWRLASIFLGGSSISSCLQELELLCFVIWARDALGDPGKAKRFRFFLLAGALLAALYALAQSFGLDPLASERAAQGFSTRSFSTLGNPDFWAAYLVLILPFSWPWPLLAAAFMLALVLSQTRAALVAALLGNLIWFWKGNRRAAGMLLALLALAFTIYSLPNPLNPGGLQSFQRLASVFSPGNQDASGRRIMREAGLRILETHPLLGVGPGQLATAFLGEQAKILKEEKTASEPYRYTEDLHNDWIQVACESGLPALLFLFGITFFAVREAWREKAYWLLALLLGFSFDACFHFPYYVLPSQLLFWLGIAWALRFRVGDDRPGLPFQGPILVCLALLTLFLSGREMMASALLNRAMNESLTEPSLEANANLQASLRLRDDSRAWMRLGLNLDAQGDNAAAAAAFHHAERIPEGLADEGLSEAKEGHLEEGRRLSQAALDLNPRNLEAWGNLGKIDYLSGRMPDAEADYQKALSLDPQWSEAYYNLAAMHINTKHLAEARAELERYLALVPADQRAQALLKSLP